LFDCDGIEAAVALTVVRRGRLQKGLAFVQILLLLLLLQLNEFKGLMGLVY
jgi:hypothetical protein